jgi:hypothetical protein
MTKDYKDRISCKSHFADRTKIIYQREKFEPEDAKNSPWDYRCPQYDQRSSNFINAGTHYGVSHAQPVGHEGNPKKEGVPFGRVKTMRVDEVG